MSKRIVICCDGTWNTPDQTDQGVISPTNAAKIAMCVAPLAGDGRLLDSRTGLYRLVPEYVRPIEPSSADNTAVAPEAWQRFDADPTYRTSCPTWPGWTGVIDLEKGSRTFSPAKLETAWPIDSI